MKKYILLFLFCFPAGILAGTSFNELFDADLDRHNPIADRVAAYHTTDIALDIQSRQSELEALQQNLDAITRTSPDEPLYWFINGLNHNNLAALFAEQKNKTATRQHIEQRNLAYKKALLLDQLPPLKLSATIYAAMKHGLPEADKIEAIESEIKQGGSGVSDDQYIQLHWSRVNALEKSGRHDEAQSALREMQREISQRNLKSPDYQLIIDRAQSEINKGRAADQKQTASPQPGKQETASMSKSSEPLNKDLMWVIFFGVLALVSLWMIVRAWRSK